MTDPTALRERVEAFGAKCVAFSCWNYTSHRSGLCASCRHPGRHLLSLEGGKK